jgi:hypothetical protein
VPSSRAAANATFALNSAECFFRTCLIPVTPSPQAILGAGLSLNHLSSVRGPAQAAASLARLWRDQGKHREAHDLLAPVYGWFTEGFDTPVLQDAKGLLDQLA